MMKTYQVLGRVIQADPEIKYIKPSGVTSQALMQGTARFEPFDVEGFLAVVNTLPAPKHRDLRSGLELHLMECRSILGFIEATEGDYNAELVVEDGLVEGATPLRTEELKEGLRNTIGLFERLGGW